eukprot:265549_1
MEDSQVKELSSVIQNVDKIICATENELKRLNTTLEVQEVQADLEDELNQLTIAFDRKYDPQPNPTNRATEQKVDHESDDDDEKHQSTFAATADLIDPEHMKEFAKEIEANFDMDELRKLFQPHLIHNKPKQTDDAEDTKQEDIDIDMNALQNDLSAFLGSKSKQSSSTDDERTEEDEELDDADAFEDDLSNFEDMKKRFMQNISEQKDANQQQKDKDERTEIAAMEQLQFNKKSAIKDIELQNRNCSINYRVMNEQYLNSKEEMKGYPLLLIHGLFDSHHTWDLLLPKLMSYEQSIIAVSLKGFGESKAIDMEACKCTMDEYLDDIMALLSALGITKAIWIGYDLGSLIVENAAIEYEHMVHKMILIAPHYTMPYLELDALKSEIEKDRAQNVNPGNKEFVDKRMAESKECNQRILRDTFRGMQEFEGVKYLKYIGCPVYIFVGSKDKIFTVQDSHHINKQIKSAFIMEFPEGNHHLIWDTSVISRLGMAIWDFCRR